MLQIIKDGCGDFITEYLLANQSVTSNFEIPYLKPFRIKAFKNKLNSVYKEFSNKKTTQIYQGQNEISNKVFELQLRINSESEYLLNAGNDCFLITKSTIQIAHANPRVEILLGPVLILNLALNEVFCFHSSAFIYKRNLFIIFAESNVGKSSIARYFDSLDNGERVSDDITCLGLENKHLLTYPRFPQLKLKGHQQLTRESISLTPKLLFTNLTDEANSLSTLSSIESLKRLINHSVASRLFDNQILKSHVEFCNRLSATASSYHLNYSHTKGSLQKLQGLFDEII